MVIWAYTSAVASERVCLQVERRPGDWKCATNLEGLRVSLGLMMPKDECTKSVDISHAVQTAIFLTCGNRDLFRVAYIGVDLVTQLGGEAEERGCEGVGQGARRVR